MPIPAAPALWSSLFALAVVGLWASSAAADPRLDEVVYSPYVEAHTLELEARGAHQNGGSLRGSTTTVTEAEYGVNDRLSLALVVAHGKEGSQARRRLHGVGDGLLVHDVGVDIDRAVAQLLGQGLAALVGHVGDHHLGAQGGQPARRGPAEPSGAAGDDC